MSKSVYFSYNLLEHYPNEWQRIESVLIKHRVKFDLLKATKDIWCRDYMPILNAENRPFHSSMN